MRVVIPGIDFSIFLAFLLYVAKCKYNPQTYAIETSQKLSNLDDPNNNLLSVSISLISVQVIKIRHEIRCRDNRPCDWDYPNQICCLAVRKANMVAVLWEQHPFTMYSKRI